MADRITQIVRSTGFDPRHMILEIIETAAMTEVAHAVIDLDAMAAARSSLEPAGVESTGEALGEQEST